MDLMNTVIDMAGIYFTTILRWIFMILALFILARQIRSLLRARNPSEIWAYLSCPDGSSVPLTHWENLIGRGRGCDVVVNLGSVSRSHATLIRDSAGVWKYNDLESKNGSAINGVPVTEPTEVKGGDTINIGGSDFALYPVSLQERMENIEKRKKKTHPVSPWPSLVALTIFQILAIAQFRISLGDKYSTSVTAAFMLVCIVMWVYVIVMRLVRRVGFEMEMIAFFLSTLSIAVTSTKYPETAFKQAFCVAAGVILFFGMCWLLRDLNRAKKLARILMGAAVILLLINLIFGDSRNGSTNWVRIAGFTIQPSELVKIVFIFVGSATLDELQQKKNLTVFMVFSVFCLGCLALMGDFGTALIFFTTFLIISFLRSGDFSKLILIVGATGLMGLMVLRFKPYVAARFGTWGHAWEDPTDGGFQMVQTMSASASGGFVGLGGGQGHLKWVDAAEADLVFGLLGEEWGLIIAVLAVLCIITLSVFAVRSIIAGRSTYYSIAACAATSMFIMQTILNVLGSVDLLPLTGVTFPFVSAGGTSMLATWGLLAYLKAADTRQNASFAIRLDRKNEFDLEEYEDELSGDRYQDPRDFFTQFGGTAANMKKGSGGGAAAGAPGDTIQGAGRRGSRDDDRMERYEQMSRQAAQRSRKGRKPDPEAMKDYTEDALSETRTHIGSDPSGSRGPIKYTNVSDDDFFGSFSREPYREPPRKKPVYNGKGLSKADDEFLTKMMDGPAGNYESDRKPSSAGRSKPAGRSSSGSAASGSSGASGSRTSSARGRQAPAGRSASSPGGRTADASGSSSGTSGRGSRPASSASSDGTGLSVSRGPDGWSQDAGTVVSGRPAGRSGSASGRTPSGRSSDTASDTASYSVGRRRDAASGRSQGHPASGLRSSGAVPGTSRSDRPASRRNTKDDVEEQLTLEDIFGGDDK